MSDPVTAAEAAVADELEIEELATTPSGAAESSDGAYGDFRVRLANFEGPFDLLLSLINKRQLDVTEVALSQVTDEFLSYLGQVGDWDLAQATEFLLVASTLLDLKAARLLPAGEVEDEEDLALLEARDLLFARLLQYRAYKLAAAYLKELEHNQSTRFGRAVSLEPQFTSMLPELVLTISPQRLAELAAAALTPRQAPTVGIDHIHAPRVSVAEHMVIMRERLRASGSTTFRSLVSDCSNTLEIVARFLGLLELYREGAVAFDQAAALAELRVRWVAADGAGQPPAPEQDTERASEIDEEYG